MISTTLTMIHKESSFNIKPTKTQSDLMAEAHRPDQLSPTGVNILLSMAYDSKYQSGFRKSKSTNDRLFHLSQTIMESFNRGEHVIAAFLDVEKAFDNAWHNGLRCKIYQLDLPTKLCW